MIWEIVKHRDLSITDSLRIASLKDQHWQYGIESQIQWMKDNIEADDIHLMGVELEAGIISLKVYMTLINLTVQIDDQFIDCFGVGNVCVNKDSQHKGLGRALLKEAEKYISFHHKLGILLCKDALIPFYKKNGWNLIRYNTAIVADRQYENNIMLLNRDCVCTNIVIEKNF